MIETEKPEKYLTAKEKRIVKANERWLEKSKSNKTNHLWNMHPLMRKKAL